MNGEYVSEINKEFMMIKRIKKLGLFFVPALVIAVPFIESLFFKFSAAEKPVHIFQTIEDWSGLPFFEPHIRIIIGILELIAAILVLIPLTQLYGAILAFGIMSGAIFFHLFTPLGIVVLDDGGFLFGAAVLVWLAALFIIWRRRTELIVLLQRFGLFKN